jgi:hypothetical protein
MSLTKSPHYFVRYYYITQILYILLLDHPFSNLHACHLHFVLSTSYPVMYHRTKWSAFTTLPSHCSSWFLFQSGWLPLDLHRISPLPSPLTAVIISNNSCFFHNSPSSLPDLDLFQIQAHVTTVLHVVRCVQYCRGCKFTPTVNHVGVLSTHDQFRTLLSHCCLKRSSIHANADDKIRKDEDSNVDVVSKTVVCTASRDGGVCYGIQNCCAHCITWCGCVLWNPKLLCALHHVMVVCDVK